MAELRWCKTKAEIQAAVYGRPVPRQDDRRDYLARMETYVPPKNMKISYCVFIGNPEIVGVVAIEDSGTQTVSPSLYVEFLFPITPQQQAPDGLPVEHQRFWAALVNAHRATILRGLAVQLLGKPWKDLKKDDVGARR
jgi:hypothetical protein